MLERMAEASPRLMARVAGVFYLFNFMTGAFAAFGGGSSATLGDVANLLATAFPIVVTVLFYSLYKPVDKQLSLIAALFSLAGCTLGVLKIFHLRSRTHKPLGVFRILLSFDRLSDLQISLSATGFGSIDGGRRAGMAHLLVSAPGALVIAIQPCPRNARRRIVDPVATREGRER